MYNTLINGFLTHIFYNNNLHIVSPRMISINVYGNKGDYKYEQNL